MTSTKLCIALANEAEPRFGSWDEDDMARRSARAILVDVNDRRGMGTDGVDDETVLEIVESWAEIIRNVYSGVTG